MKEVIYRLFVLAAVFALMSLIARPVWNAIMPDIFGVCKISYWQTYGLIVLCNIFFRFKKPK